MGQRGSQVIQRVIMWQLSCDLYHVIILLSWFHSTWFHNNLTQNSVDFLEKSPVIPINNVSIHIILVQITEKKVLINITSSLNILYILQPLWIIKSVTLSRLWIFFSNIHNINRPTTNNFYHQYQICAGQTWVNHAILLHESNWEFSYFSRGLGQSPLSRVRAVLQKMTIVRK